MVSKAVEGPVETGSRDFDVGRVVHATIQAVRTHGFLLALIAIPFLMAPEIAGRFLTSGPDRLHPFSWLYWSRLLGWPLLRAILTTLYNSWVALVVMRSAGSGSLGMGRFREIAVRCLMLAAVAVIYELGVVAGAILLVVPGLILALAWSVAAIAMAAEGVGIREAFVRSAALTRGCRWKILSMALLWGIPTTIVEFLALKMLRPGLSMTAAARTTVGELVMGPIWLVSSVIFAAGLASIYLELLKIKDGAARAEVAEIFA